MKHVLTFIVGILFLLTTSIFFYQLSTTLHRYEFKDDAVKEAVIVALQEKIDSNPRLQLDEQEKLRNLVFRNDGLPVSSLHQLRDLTLLNISSLQDLNAFSSLDELTLKSINSYQLNELNNLNLEIGHLYLQDSTIDTLDFLSRYDTPLYSLHIRNSKVKSVGSFCNAYIALLVLDDSHIDTLSTDCINENYLNFKFNNVFINTLDITGFKGLDAIDILNSEIRSVFMTAEQATSIEIEMHNSYIPENVFYKNYYE